jgi:hypothetical protein
MGALFVVPDQLHVSPTMLLNGIYVVRGCARGCAAASSSKVTSGTANRQLDDICPMPRAVRPRLRRGLFSAAPVGYPLRLGPGAVGRVRKSGLAGRTARFAGRAPQLSLETLGCATTRSLDQHH